MALKVGKLIKDRFFFDDAETGFYYDLAPIKRVSNENEGGLGVRIGLKNDEVKAMETDPANQAFYCTLFLNDTQLGNLPDKYKQQFASQTFLMLFRPGATLTSIAVSPWDDYFNDGFVWSSATKVYTKYTGNNLGHRFKRVTKEYVEAAAGGTVTPPPAGDTDTGGDTDTIPDNGMWDGVIHVECPFCGKQIF